MESEQEDNNLHAAYHVSRIEDTQSAGASNELPYSQHIPHQGDSEVHANDDQTQPSEDQSSEHDIPDEDVMEDPESLSEGDTDAYYDMMLHNSEEHDRESEDEDEESDEEAYDSEETFITGDNSDEGHHTPLLPRRREGKYIEFSDPLQCRCHRSRWWPRLDRSNGRWRRTTIIPFNNEYYPSSRSSLINYIVPHAHVDLTNYVLRAVERIPSRDEGKKEEIDRIPGTSPFEKASVAAPAIRIMMDYFNQRDVDAIRAISRTMRMLWPAKLLGKGVRCEMMFPPCSFLESVDNVWQGLSEPRDRCNVDSSSKLRVLPCEGNKYGLAKHGPDFNICEECHVSTLFDFRQAQHYVFGSGMRSKICNYRSNRWTYISSERNWLYESCKCQNEILKSRLCWDCRRILIRRAWRRNEIRWHAGYLPNGIPPSELEEGKQSTVNAWLHHAEVCSRCRLKVRAVWPRKEEEGYETKLESGNDDVENVECKQPDISVLMQDPTIRKHVDGDPEELAKVLQWPLRDCYDSDYKSETDNPFEDGTFLEQLAAYYRDDRLAEEMRRRCGICDGVTYDLNEFLQSTSYFCDSPFYDNPECDPMNWKHMYVCLCCSALLPSRVWPRYLERKQRENKT